MYNIIRLDKAKNQLNLFEKIGQLFMPAAFINDTEEEIVQLENLIKNHTIGGLCFFHSRASAATNFEGKKKVVYNKDSFATLKKLILRYQSAAKYPLLIAIDAEWGLAMRIENTPQYPYAITLGAIAYNNELIYEVGKNIAIDCKRAGIHWNLSPVVDINNNPNNPVIGYRSFGENKDLVTEKALAYVKGTQSEGILTSIKHFPGHGDTATDSHLGIPIISKSKKELIENELYPFQKLIDEGVDSVMVGHLSVPALANGKRTPSSISKEIIKGTLRKELDFDGVVISDALNMHAVSKDYPIPGELEWLAFDAGNDILCFAEHVEEGICAIQKNATALQIEKSFERVWKLKEKAFKNIAVLDSQEIAFENAKKLNKKIAELSLTMYTGSAEAISEFRKENYCTLTLKRYGSDQSEKEIKNTLKLMGSEIQDENHILILLTPPQIKPTHNFGFLQEELDFINKTIGSKKVVLYHFGNPYALQKIKIENTTATIIAYQNFKEFQDVATLHFQGELKAIGKLPISIF
ncbi:glycoside hydrolase family 3 protein [Maribacter sp. CXY002]|uniref:glycoside hydrolase family 3 protein n=1 Tax=Maribacter luteocoastalis TaxID=3407671 RepID=UPI003B66FFB6